MKEIVMEWEFSGRNVEAAIKSGLRELSLSREDVEIKILDEGKAGLFGLMGAVPARIKIISSKRPDTVNWKKAEARAMELTKLVAGMIEPGVKVESKKAGKKINIVLNGGNRALLIGKSGSNLRAMNYIINLMMKKDKDTRTDITLDVGGYNSKLLRDAVTSLNEAVRRVRSSGNEVELKPMEAEQRKAVHQKAKDFDDIRTESVGRDGERRIVVKRKS